MSEAMELRVLSGLHRDARCRIQDGSSLGSSANCDVILTDDGIVPYAARVRIGPDHWDFLIDGEQSGKPFAHPFNRPVPLGMIWVTIARNKDPWPRLPVFSDGAVCNSEKNEAAYADLLPGDALDQNIPLKHTPRLAPASRSRSRVRDAWPLILGVIAILLAIFVAIVLPYISTSTPTYASTIDPRKTAAEKTVDKISALFEHMGMASQLHTSLSSDYAVTVSGWVRNKDEQDAVSTALSQIWPMPALRINNEAELQQTARAALGAFGIKYDPQYQGDGRLNIIGIAASEAERASALDALRAQFPGMMIYGNDIVLSRRLSETFLKSLADEGLSDIAMAWKPDSLEITPGNLNDEQRQYLQERVAEFNKRYLDVAVIASSGTPPRANSVPFEIRSVVGGRQPFVVLADGSKLLPGGIYRNYRLVAVEKTRIIFEGPKTAIVAR